METATLTIHIISFSLSLVLFPVLAVAAVGRYYLSKMITRASLALTATGLTTGISLLIIHPAGTRCLLLATYLVSFIALYYAAVSVPAPIRSTVTEKNR
jgi:hypothetical protein